MITVDDLPQIHPGSELVHSHVPVDQGLPMVQAGGSVHDCADGLTLDGSKKKA